MDAKEAKHIKVDDRVVIWAESPDACTGTTIEVGYNAVKVKWDDGQIGIIHHGDMSDVARHYGKASIVPTPKVEA
jgi:hypothetical protein